MTPAIDALAERVRVITFSLADEPSAHARFDEHSGFSNYVEQVRSALEQCGLERASICGVSYGGLIAALFAARYPERVSSLILVSALPPSWRPDARVSSYLRFPWLLAPLFCLGSVRLYEEIAAAHDGWRSGATAAYGAGIRALRHMFHPGRMARRVRLCTSAFCGADNEQRIGAALRRVKVPTLILTGEERLERVVPPAATRKYLDVWPHAEVKTLPRTGHLGLITRPREFAELITAFAAKPANELPHSLTGAR
jgi:pimeloyl-ACP methyl ester carboxylesterase